MAIVVVWAPTSGRKTDFAAWAVMYTQVWTPRTPKQFYMPTVQRLPFGDISADSIPTAFRWEMYDDLFHRTQV